MKSQLLALTLVAAAGAAMAQNAPYATIGAVSGAVTVSSKDTMVTATPGMALKQGQSVVTSNAGSATVLFASGCSVALKPGQMVAVQESECSAIQAKRVRGQFAFAGEAAGSAATGGEGEEGLTNLQLAGIGVGAVLIINELTKSDNNNTTTTPPTETPVETPVVVNKPPSKTPSKTPVSGS